MPRSQKGGSNPVASIDDATVRRIRLHYIDGGESISAIARSYQLSVPCVSRLCRWMTWAYQDADLKAMPRPVHKRGISQPLTEEEKEARQIAGNRKRPKFSCLQCLHLNNNGNCGFGFPECLSTGYSEASKCNAFVAIHA